MEKIKDLKDEYLLDRIEVSANASIPLLNGVEYNSKIWNIYVSGLAYGIWIAICDIKSISLESIGELINNQIKTILN